jgi:hypothetical protein
LSTIRTLRFFKSPGISYAFLLLSVGLFSATVTFAQVSSPASAATETVDEAMLTLPDAPTPSIAGEIGSSSSVSSSAADGAGDYFDVSPSAHKRYAPRRNMTIFPDERAQPLNGKQKFVMGLTESASVFSVTGWFASAGWAQLTNGSPNYGTDRGAFGMRLGTAAIRNTSENIFGDAILAPLLHEDPRYYVMGDQRNFFRRLIYAGTRVLITRTDSGKATPNLSLIGGNLAGSALTNAYYPELNQGFKQTALTFGGSIGGSALGFAVSEFYDDALHLVHIKKGQ